MQNHDQRFEEFLREFEPTRPQAFPEMLVANPWNWQRLAAAAIVIIACGSGFWFASPRSQHLSTQSFQQGEILSPSQAFAGSSPSSRINRNYSRAELQRLALEDPAKFDAALFAAAPNTLPSFTHPGSLLSVLAKD
ncbi:MAG: hypothetical protein ABSG69_16305 [Candidatus Acidiferrum sp.]|jgi:hypothetical protein